MINLEKIAEELFNKIRGRYPKITIGDEASTITNVPEKARFFDFEFSNGNKVNVTLDEKSLTMLYNNDLLTDASETIKQNWYSFMKEMRQFAKKRMLNFDTRDITKSNLDKRDYDYLSKNRPGENQMSESKLYGTSKTSFQDVGNAKIIVKHNEAVDFENPAGRTQRIHSIYVESPEGERYKYPFKHLNGARAMAQHVSEGGNQYDNFGKHIVSLSEELSKLRTFKTYMNRSNVMAEGLAGYMDIVNSRIDTVKETVHKLQRNSYYKEALENFQETVMEEVPADVSSNWIDELTIRQFNEDLKGVFPYIYNLVKEGTKPEELTPENLLGDADTSDPVEEGAVKRALEDDAESMSREEFIEKHGDAEFYDEYNGVEDESMDMSSDFASHLDNVVANSKHEQGPNEVSSMGMNKYGLAAKHKDGKFISYKDGKETGTFDSIEELEKHQKGLIQDESTTFEGNAFAQAVQKAKAAGMKKGDKFKTPDGEEHTLEDAILKAGLRLEDFWTADELMAEKEPTDDDTMDVKIGPDGSISKADGDAEEKGEKNELDLDEFIKGHFDYTTNNFPKGETAVLTACEKKYGDDSLAPAAIIMKKLVTNQDGEMERIKHLAGLAN